MKTRASESSRYARVDEIFQRAADLAPAERAAFLDRECGSDLALRSEVEAFLAADGELEGFLEKPIGSFPADLLANDEEGALAGGQFGPYRVIREIGRGGLGVVYLAARADDVYRKEVAIKLIRRGLDTDDILRRFRNERQILAQLDHPNIARLIDGGTSDDGLPYFVLEYVQGDPINVYCETRRLDLHQRLDLFRKVCAAVTYAHQNLVIHRDLKPSNILVTAEGEPKLLDFGIAKLLTAENDMFTMTAPAERVMTPDYASPEQITGEKITTASDVYSLGVLLYELLTGQKPYRLKTGTTAEISRALLEQAPQRPSAAAAANPRLLHGDLDNIVLMALRKEPERRYTSVELFAEDIRRHLDGRPVLAHKDTFVYRATKFVHRNKAGVIAATIVVLSLLGGIIATTMQSRIATAERDRARREAVKSERVITFLQNVLGFSDPAWTSSNPERKRDATIAEALIEASHRAENELANEPEALATVRFTIGTTYRVQSRYPEAEPHLRASLEIRRRVLGDDHPETARSMVALGEWCIATGRHPEAEALFREALPIFRSAQDIKWLAVALNDFGVLKSEMGDHIAAEVLLREGLDVSAVLKGADRAPRAIMLSALGAARRDQGDLNEAKRFLQQSIDEHRALPGGLRSELAFTLRNLGRILVLQDDFERAESLLAESFELFRKTLGDNHQSTAYPLLTLAELYYKREEYEKARSVIEHAMQIQHRALPPEHLDLTHSRVTLAKILTRTGALTEAEAYLRSALEKMIQTLPPDHAHIGSAGGALGECLTVQTRYAEAEPLLLQSHNIAEKRYGPADPRTLVAKERLRRLYEAREKPQEADPFRH